MTVTADMLTMLNRFFAAIDRLTVPASSYAREAERLRTITNSGSKLFALTGVVTALRNDIEAGYLESIIELAHGTPTMVI